MVTLTSRSRANWSVSTNMATSVASMCRSVLIISVPGMLRWAVAVFAITGVTEASGCASADVLGYTLELVVTLVTASQRTSLMLEVTHAHGGQSSSLVVGSRVVVNLVDGDSGVHNIGLDSLLLNDRLDSLVDVVMHVFASDGGRDALALRGTLDEPLIFELRLFLNKIPLRGIVVTLIKFAVLNGTKLGRVLLWQDLAILNWLNSAVVVVLVDFLVYCCVDFLVLVRLDCLLSHRRSDSLVDGGVMVS